MWQIKGAGKSAAAFALLVLPGMHGYERVETARGSSAADAKVTVSQMTPGQFKMTRQGGKIVLERPNDRREYDAQSFTYIPNGRILRKYRRCHDDRPPLPLVPARA